MAKLTTKIAIPIILVGAIAILVFMSIGYENIPTSFYVVFVLLFIFVFFFGLAVGQRYSAIMKKVLGGASELSRGNLSSRVYLESKDELAELAKTINKIAEELEASREREACTEQSVNIKVQAKTQDLQETINALEQKVKNRTIEIERLTAELNKFKKA